MLPICASKRYEAVGSYLCTGSCVSGYISQVWDLFGLHQSPDEISSSLAAKCSTVYKLSFVGGQVVYRALVKLFVKELPAAEHSADGSSDSEQKQFSKAEGNCRVVKWSIVNKNEPQLSIPVSCHCHIQNIDGVTIRAMTGC